jgi:hypothetical protein
MVHRIRVLLLIALPCSAFSQNGRLQGTVRDDSGNPVAGAYAVATAQSGNGHSTYTVMTGKKGEYSLENLKPGKYTVCVHKPGGFQLNSCQWSAGDQFTVGKGETLADRTLSVAAGALLQIRIADPGKVMSASDDLLIGVFLPGGLFQPMRLVSQDPTGRTYDIAVPKQTPLRLSINSTQFRIADDKGGDLSPRQGGGGSLPAAAAAGAVVTLPGFSAVNGPPITFTVTGKR